MTKKHSLIFKTYGMFTLDELEQYEKDAKEMILERDEDLTEEDITDSMISEEIWEDIDLTYDAEVMNLDKKLSGRVIAIADLGLWNGRVAGYKILGDNLNEVVRFGMSCDEREVYCDAYNVRAKGYHHDGKNYVLFRELREDKDIDKFLDKIYNNEEISSGVLNYYTKSLRPYVQKIYGI
jgi:hypothetical protein